MNLYPQVGRTIPHEVTGRFGSCRVRIIPASPGTGVIAGAAVRAPLEMMGVQDCLTKSFGSNNPKNLVKAVINGLEQLRQKSEIEDLRSVKVGTTIVEESIKRGEAFLAPAAPPASDAPAAPAEGKAAGGKPAGGKKDKPAPRKPAGKQGGGAEAKAEDAPTPEKAETAPAPAETPEGESS